MTPLERISYSLRHVLGERLAERIRTNLPSRKPQLWERFPKALLRRAYIACRSVFGRRFPVGEVVLSIPPFDILIRCSPSERLIDRPPYLYGIYEISGTRFLQQVIQPGRTVIDVGANSGYFSLIAARLTGAQGHVYAFEPVAEPFERLRRNLALNHLRNVVISRSLVGSTVGRSVVYPSVVADNDGLGSVFPSPSRAMAGDEVPVTTLDHLTRDLPDKRIDLIKVDVEGAEAQVFDGARNVLQDAEAPALLFESFDIETIVERLERFGYDVRHVQYSLRQGLEFPRVGAHFDNLFAAYEAPNYVALKPNGRFGSFQEISIRSKHTIPAILRLLAAVA